MTKQNDYPLGANTQFPSGYMTKKVEIVGSNNGIGPIDKNNVFQVEMESISRPVRIEYADGRIESPYDQTANNASDSMTAMYNISASYKYNEGKYIQEITDYINDTYDQHYSTKSGTQSIDAIIDNGHGTGFCMGNITKYAHRYGKKKGHNRADLMKIIHYAILMLHVHDSTLDKD